MTYPELVQLFRQSFSPIDRLGQGRLALAEMQNQREREDAVRQAALNDHITGIRLQDNLLRDRQAMANEQALANARLSAQMNNDAHLKNLEATTKAQRYTRAMQDAAQNGLDISPEDFKDSDSFVNAVNKQVAGMQRDFRKQAATVSKHLREIEKQIGSYSPELTDAEKRPILLGAARQYADKKTLAKLDAGEVPDSELEGLAGSVGQKSLALAAKNKATAYEKRVAPLRDTARSLRQRESVLLGKGIISPEEDLGDIQPVPAGGADGAPDLASLFNGDAAAGGGGAGRTSRAPSGAPGSIAGTVADTFEGGGQLLTPVVGGRALMQGLNTARSLQGPGLSGFSRLAAGAGRIAAGAGPRALAGPVGLASLVNEVPSYLGLGDPLLVQGTNAMIRATGNDAGGQREYARQQLATIYGLQKQASASGDAELALRLGQLATGPDISPEAIQEVVTNRVNGPGIYQPTPGATPRLQSLGF